MAEYIFTKVTREDYPMLRGWLAQPHVQAWWGSPEEEISLIEEDIEKGPTDMRIVHHESRPFAYVQDYPAHYWPMPHYAPFPKGTRAIDTFIGDPQMLGQGHAARYLRARAEMLLAEGVQKVVIDPSPENTRAVRAYRSAGFRGDEIRPCEDGDPVIVMEFCPSSPHSSEKKQTK